jgi:hypothetical protein
MNRTCAKMFEINFRTRRFSFSGALRFFGVWGWKKWSVFVFEINYRPRWRLGGRVGRCRLVRPGLYHNHPAFRRKRKNEMCGGRTRKTTRVLLRNGKMQSLDMPGLQILKFRALSLDMPGLQVLKFCALSLEMPGLQVLKF